MLVCVRVRGGGGETQSATVWSGRPTKRQHIDVMEARAPVT